ELVGKLLRFRFEEARREQQRIRQGKKQKQHRHGCCHEEPGDGRALPRGIWRGGPSQAIISCHFNVQSLRRAPITSESGNWVLAICSLVVSWLAANCGGSSTPGRVGLEKYASAHSRWIAGSRRQFRNS